LLEYDDVNNKQRQAVYGMPRQLLEGIDQKERVMEMVRGIVDQYVDSRCPDDKHPDTWDLPSLRTDVLSQFGYKLDLSAMASMTPAEIAEFVFERLREKYQEKEKPVLEMKLVLSCIFMIHEHQLHSKAVIMKE